MISQKGIIEVMRSFRSKGFDVAIVKPGDMPEILIDDRVRLDFYTGDIKGTVKPEEVDVFIDVLKLYTPVFEREGSCSKRVSVTGNIFKEVVFSC